MSWYAFNLICLEATDCTVFKLLTGTQSNANGSCWKAKSGIIRLEKRTSAKEKIYFHAAADYSKWQ